MIHDRNRNVPEIVDRIHRYAELQAQSMLDRGQRFSARAMASALGGRAYRQFVIGRAWRDGVPGMFRAAILVGFHFYIWVAFWQLSGARRTAEDDRYVRRLGLAMESLRRAVVVGGLPRRVARRIAALAARR
jgi:hypothetical protein